jgi:hypothetical protein
MKQNVKYNETFCNIYLFQVLILSYNFRLI